MIPVNNAKAVQTERKKVKAIRGIKCPSKSQKGMLIMCLICLVAQFSTEVTAIRKSDVQTILVTMG